MIRNDATKILDLIKKNEGIEAEEAFNSNFEFKKIMDIILSECRCSIVDKDGNYARFGSSTDIRIIKMLVQRFLSNSKEISPEVVSMALTKEGVIGPFQKIGFIKKYNENQDLYDIDMDDIFPYEFHVNMLKTDLNLREKLITEVIKPYVKNIILDNEVLMSKSPISSYINKYIIRFLIPPKSDEELRNNLNKILKDTLSNTNAKEELIENIANYIFVNIMGNKFFKDELIDRTLDATELQKLGKISIGFNSLVESMSYETIQMIELRNFPYGEFISIKDTYYTTMAVLEALSMSFDEIDEQEVLKRIEKINRLYNITNRTKNQNSLKYRNSEISTSKYGESDEFVKPEKIKDSLENLCKMIEVLISKKDEIDNETYIKEVLRIHYRFIKIHPFESGNGRTARAIVNILLQSKGMIGIFRKEKRKDYLDYIKEANKVIKKNESKYLAALSEKTMECIEMENEFLSIGDLPFLLVNG